MRCCNHNIILWYPNVLAHTVRDLIAQFAWNGKQINRYQCNTNGTVIKHERSCIKFVVNATRTASKVAFGNPDERTANRRCYLPLRRSRLQPGRGR
jgi:hypothetical protein